ncbi:MAG: HEAT repeat domain-containing protein [Planctomycetes bacterium]|nr:HEAT repeat domain-containing protein [Planctomycetota bacterium]
MDKSRYAFGWIVLLAIIVSILGPMTVRAADNQLPPLEKQLIETLRSAAPEEKAIACKQLAIYGSKAAVPELAKLLANEQLASWSRIALEAIPDPAADAALVEAAETLQGKLLVGTINSIGVRRSAQAVDRLAARLKDKDAEVASAAAVALGQIGNDKALKTLRQSLAGAPPAVRSAVAEGCILCAERLLADGNGRAAAEVFDTVRKADVPKQRVLEAIRGAIIARGAQGVPLLVEQLKSPDKGRFQIALSTARELPGREVVEALSAELASAAPERASLIVYALGEREDAVLPPAVLRAARSGDERVRLAAIAVVGRLGDASTVPALLEIAAESDAELSQAAKTALVGLPGKKVDVELSRRLPAAKGNSLAILIGLVGERRIDATPDLVKALDNPDKSIRSAALTALGATVGPKDLKVLISAVVDAKNAADAELPVRALQAASVRMPDREATAAELAAAMPRASTATKKASLLKILGAMGGPKALETIAAAVKGGDEKLQDAGTRVLGEWMTADAAPVLLTIAKDSSSENKYQIRALRGYLRIARQLDLPDDQRIDMCRQAIAIAERPEERGLALDALKRCPSAEAVELASSLLDDKEIRDRAVETAIFIGEKIKDKDPAAAKSAGEKALEASPPKELADRARALTAP